MTGSDERGRSASAMDSFDHSADVVVVGAGMGGLVSAVRAAECGAEVIVLEKGPRAGGSMYLSNGMVYTYDSYERIREDVPDGNPMLQELVVESRDEALAWLEDVGASTTDPDKELAFGSGKRIDPREFTRTMVDYVEQSGGEVRLETAMEELVVDDGGNVAGVVSDGESGRERIGARSVIVATGGFQGNEALVERFITDRTDNLWLRSNPWSTGDGLLAALDAGAKTTAGMASFYGHNLPAPPAEIPPEKLYEAKQDYGVFAVALDERGRRFTDETQPSWTSDGPLTQDTAKRAGGRAYLVIDADVYDSHNRGVYVGKRVETARELGGRVGTADSIEGVGGVLDGWGVDGGRAVETIREYNDAIESDGSLVPPRRKHRISIDSPPFYVVEVQPGITFTMGGLDVTENMEVLRRSRSSSTLHHYPDGPREVLADPIPGLYAAGVDVGNVMRRFYSGGLIVGLVTGRIAGANAARSP